MLHRLNIGYHDNRPGDVIGKKEKSYSRYVLFLLLAISVSNYVDRSIINILVEPIKHELRLADWQLGVVTGVSFAIFYSMLGLPIARLADRSNRPLIIVVSVLVWSAFTFLSGSARSFPQLFAARVGVGCGEGGATPPSHSLLSEITTPETRSSALATLSLGGSIGSLLGLGLGGVIGEMYGWRAALWIAAAPGPLLALLMALTVKEPRKVRRPTASSTSGRSTLAGAWAEMRSKPSFWWIAAAGACSAFVVNGQGAFYSSFFLLRYGRELSIHAGDLGPLGIVGLSLGVVRCVGGIAGTLAGGFWGDRGVARDRANYCTVPLISLTLGAPFCAVALLVPGAVPALIFLLAPSFVSGLIFGPTFAAIQHLASPQQRATLAAVFLFVINIIGLGLGPLCVGALSDAMQSLLPRTDALEFAMLAICPVMWIGSFCFVMARRSIVRDLHTDDPRTDVKSS